MNADQKNREFVSRIAHLEIDGFHA